jgi:hypothetical protein
MVAVRARGRIVAAAALAVTSLLLIATPASAGVGETASAPATATACDEWRDALTTDLVAALARAGVDVDALRIAIAGRDARAALALLEGADLHMLFSDARASVRAALAALAQCRAAAPEEPVVVEPAPVLPDDEPAAVVPEVVEAVPAESTPAERPAVEHAASPDTVVTSPSVAETAAPLAATSPASESAPRAERRGDSTAPSRVAAPRHRSPALLRAPAHDADGGVRQSELVSTTASLTASASPSSLARFGETAARLLPLLAALGFALVLRRQVVAAAIERRRARA